MEANIPTTEVISERIDKYTIGKNNRNKLFMIIAILLIPLILILGIVIGMSLAQPNTNNTNTVANNTSNANNTDQTEDEATETETEVEPNNESEMETESEEEIDIDNDLGFVWVRDEILVPDTTISAWTFERPTTGWKITNSNGLPEGYFEAEQIINGKVYTLTFRYPMGSRDGSTAIPTRPTTLFGFFEQQHGSRPTPQELFDLEVDGVDILIVPSMGSVDSAVYIWQKEGRNESMISMVLKGTEASDSDGDAFLKRLVGTLEL